MRSPRIIVIVCLALRYDRSVSQRHGEPLARNDRGWTGTCVMLEIRDRSKWMRNVNWNHNLGGNTDRPLSSNILVVCHRKRRVSEGSGRWGGWPLERARTGSQPKRVLALNGRVRDQSGCLIVARLSRRKSLCAMSPPKSKQSRLNVLRWQPLNTLADARRPIHARATMGAPSGASSSRRSLHRDRAKNQGVDLGAVSTILKNLIGTWRLSWNELRTAIAVLSEQS